MNDLCTGLDLISEHRRSLEQFVPLSQQVNIYKSTEEDLFWAHQSMGLALYVVGLNFIWILVVFHVQMKYLNKGIWKGWGSAACVDLRLFHWDHLFFPCNKKEPSATQLQLLFRLRVVGLNRSVVRPVLYFDLYSIQKYLVLLAVLSS